MFTISETASHELEAYFADKEKTLAADAARASLWLWMSLLPKTRFLSRTDLPFASPAIFLKPWAA